MVFLPGTISWEAAVAVGAARPALRSSGASWSAGGVLLWLVLKTQPGAS